MQERIDPRILGQRLAEARKSRGLTQEQAAQHLGCSRPTLIAIEKGERPAKPAELVKLSAFYGRQVHELVRSGEPVAADLQPHLRAAADRMQIGDGDLLKEEKLHVGKANDTLNLLSHHETDDSYPERYKFLAVHAYQREEITEGQLARFLRCEDDLVLTSFELATDDRKARQIAVERDVPVLTTAEIIKGWADVTSADTLMVASVLRNIQRFARLVVADLGAGGRVNLIASGVWRRLQAEECGQSF